MSLTEKIAVVALDRGRSIMLLERILNIMGFVVMEAESGIKAIEMVKTGGYNLVVVDDIEFFGDEEFRTIHDVAQIVKSSFEHNPIPPPILFLIMGKTLTYEEISLLKSANITYMQRPIDIDEFEVNVGLVSM